MGDTDMKCPGNLANRTRWIQSFQRKMERPETQLRSVRKVLLEGRGEVRPLEPEDARGRQQVDCQGEIRIGCVCVRKQSASWGRGGPRSLTAADPEIL